MNTEEITSFVKVAKLQHMTNAAAELNISQSALSSSIKKLELELGVRLFERRGRHIELNTYGEIFLRYAENMLLSLSQLEQELAEAKSAVENRVSIAMPPLYSWNIWIAPSCAICVTPFTNCFLFMVSSCRTRAKCSGAKVGIPAY